MFLLLSPSGLRSNFNRKNGYKRIIDMFCQNFLQMRSIKLNYFSSDLEANSQGQLSVNLWTILTAHLSCLTTEKFCYSCSFITIFLSVSFR